MNPLYRLIECSLLVRVNLDDQQRMDGFFRYQASQYGSSFVEACLRFLNDLDSKSSALLTHVSMLIAAVSFLASQEDDPGLRWILVAEAAIYVFIALGLLRCINIVNAFNVQVPEATEEGTKAYESAFAREAIIRLKVFNRTKILTILATVGFLVSIASKLV